FTGNGTTNSYDSAGLIPNGGTINPGATGGNIPLNGFGGNVGTNGNETDSGSNAQINGSLSTPNAGFGVCSAGNITAFSGKRLTRVTGGMIRSPRAISSPPPTFSPRGPKNTRPPARAPPPSAQCAPAVAPPGACGLGDISLSGGNILTLTPGVYNINSI